MEINKKISNIPLQIKCYLHSTVAKHDIFLNTNQESRQTVKDMSEKRARVPIPQGCSRGFNLTELQINSSSQEHKVSYQK